MGGGDPTAYGTTRPWTGTSMDDGRTTAFQWEMRPWAAIQPEPNFNSNGSSQPQSSPRHVGTSMMQRNCYKEPKVYLPRVSPRGPRSA